MISLTIFVKYLTFLILSNITVLTQQTEVLLTKEEFTECVSLFGFKQFPNDTYELFIDKVSQIGGIQTKLEALMAVTQLSWESAGFTATASWACSRAYDTIEYWAVREECDSYDKINCPKNNSYYGRGYAQIKDCYNYRLASFELYGDDRLVINPEIMVENNTVAMETAIWFWKHKVHNVSDVSSGHFGATTKAIISKECDESNNMTDIAKKRYNRFVDCLKVCNYTNNDYSEKGCYPLLEPSKINLTLISISALVVIAFVGIISLGCYYRVLRKNENHPVVNGPIEQYDDVDEKNEYMYITTTREEYEYINATKEEYDDTIIQK